ncbi:MAG: DUF3006 domain-containing protein [Epulopiscium sp.]|nr:DUF3006 domain-containing protein [Candidatus Epulonipiscium sp.]
MKVIIDRFEGDYAICEMEDKSIIDIKKDSLPVGAKTGDVLIVKEDKRVVIDKEGTKERKKRIEELTKNMWE